ncbi:MAG: HAMP domain-containing histidine kinase [Bacteroidetes bacterium]|nr:HAMP domain-containing histidine kinase [Bacteroidota bacterium]
MKLVSKNIIINTIVSVIILFLGEYSIYSFIRSKIQNETREHLLADCVDFIRMSQKQENIMEFKHNIGDIIRIQPIAKIEHTAPVFQTVQEEEEWEDESFTTEMVVFDVNHHGKFYRVSIQYTIDEIQDQADSILPIMLITGLGMLVMLVLVNVFVYYRLFSPVDKLIKYIEKFEIHDLKRIEPIPTTTHEFSILSAKVTKMSQNLIDDYKAMKEFTENMAHEVQTPLAVISTKIEQCLQDENLTENQAQLLSVAMKKVQKLVTLNQGLSLLSKLENHQYNKTYDINVAKLVQERISFFVDFLQNKNLKLAESYMSDMTVKMDSILAEVLIDNLIKNAIKHNVDNGTIHVTLQGNILTIANTGHAPKASVSDFFNRFYSEKSNESLGLGLSIVKKICDYYGYKINYNYENGLHSIHIEFLSSQPL